MLVVSAYPYVLIKSFNTSNGFSNRDEFIALGEKEELLKYMKENNLKDDPWLYNYRIIVNIIGGA